ncbi:MAG: signal peptidase II [Armatimonadota bacterium]
MYFILFALIEYFLDQASKYLIIKNFYLSQSIPVIKPVLYLTYIQNKGAAFGLFTNLSLLLGIISFLVIVAFIIFSYKIIKLPVIYQIPLGLILGGTAGNLTDRIRLGYVIDFIDFRVWPVFNLADTALTVSFIWLIIAVIIAEKKEFKES